MGILPMHSARVVMAGTGETPMLLKRFQQPRRRFDKTMFPLRRKTTLVEARRVQSAPSPKGGPPIIIDSAAVAAASAAAAQSGGPAPVAGTTNIFVINPGHAPPPPPATPPPTEIHHHHTTVQYLPRKRTPHYNTSFFASAGLVLGALAAACAYESGSYLPFAWPLAMAGLAAGGIAFLGAVLFRRTRTGLAVFAILLSAAAYVGWLYNSNQLQSQIDEIRRQLPKVDLGQPVTTPVAKPTTR